MTRPEMRGPDQGPDESVEREDVVKKIDLESFKEKQNLETLRLMLTQMLRSVVRNTETTDKSSYNRFNAKAFLDDLEKVKHHVEREFTCLKE